MAITQDGYDISPVLLNDIVTENIQSKFCSVFCRDNSIRNNKNDRDDGDDGEDGDDDGDDGDDDGDDYYDDDGDDFYDRVVGWF